MTSAIYGAKGDTTEERMPNGLWRKHAYSILRIEMARNNKGETVRLIRIRNPWGNSAEFTGQWSDKSRMWETIPKHTREKLLVREIDGAFWMSIEDWIANFSEYTFCMMPDNTYSGVVGTYFIYLKIPRVLTKTLFS